ncbi:MAG: delta-aminolevulinic acid dehydratase [Clostridium sp. SCN 57-10]|nr:MAG: delta-aminolevulinic acid dehydratase [Clostridium sp. SCN 57-10]
MIRGRRLRQSELVRSMVRETRISVDSLVWPLFIKEGVNIKSPIASLDGQFHYSPDRLTEAVEQGLQAGVRKFMLFGLPREKDAVGSGAYAEDGVVQQGVRAVRARLGNEAYLISDVCMCEYTDHGHCGILSGHDVCNDATLPYLDKIALSHARAGVDMVAPSDMMDGRIASMRAALDGAGFEQLPIMSYAVKYASSFYGPFREAAGSTPSFGDRKTYQMDMHNGREALREAAADEAEGADILMVKPALAYLDVIHAVREQSALPLAAYSVSGEYAMIKAASSAGLIDEYKVMCESAVSVYRAGADILITYFANELAAAIARGDIG